MALIAGSYKFVFQADPPDVSRIPSSDILVRWCRLNR
jgi:hypothetical protein